MNATDQSSQDDVRRHRAGSEEAQGAWGAQGAEEAERAETDGAEQQARGRGAERRRASWQSMVFSLAVVVAIVVALLLLVPRVGSVTQPPVDVAAGARAAAERVEFTPAVPVGLPAGWRATSVRTTPSTAAVLTWHAGFTTPSEQYAALEQGQHAPAEWLRAQINGGRQDGTLAVAGEPWDRYVQRDKGQNALVDHRGDVTTVVTGSAPFVELALLAASLRPAG